MNSYDFQLLTFFVKSSILDVWECSEDASEVRHYVLYVILKNPEHLLTINPQISASLNKI